MHGWAQCGVARERERDSKRRERERVTEIVVNNTGHDFGRIFHV